MEQTLPARTHSPRIVDLVYPRDMGPRRLQREVWQHLLMSILKFDGAPRYLAAT